MSDVMTNQTALRKNEHVILSQKINMEGFYYPTKLQGAQPYPYEVKRKRVDFDELLH